MILAGTAVMARQAILNKNLRLEDMEGVTWILPSSNPLWLTKFQFIVTISLESVVELVSINEMYHEWEYKSTLKQLGFRRGRIIVDISTD